MDKWATDIFAALREECGRFFIDQRVAFLKKGGTEVQLVQWDFGGEMLRAPIAASTHSAATPVQLPSSSDR